MDQAPRRASTSVLLGALLLIAAVGLARGQDVGPGPDADEAGEAPRLEGAFGFEIGEERRYVLGPKESLYASETAEWALSLERIEGTRDSPVAVFELWHERWEAIPGAFSFNAQSSRELMSVRVRGTLKVNLHGFPLELSFTDERQIGMERVADYGRRRVSFVFDGERYRKEVEFDRRDYDFHIAIANHDTVDLQEPSGLFVYHPGSLACLGDRETGPCGELDPAFANPGLLSLMMPLLLDEPDGEREFQVFRPAGIQAPLYSRMRLQPWVRRERNQLNNLSRYYERFGVELGVSEEIEVGGRTLHSWKVEVGPGIDRFYIEPGGRVLRVDLESTWTNGRDRWIRLQWPAEHLPGIATGDEDGEDGDGRRR